MGRIALTSLLPLGLLDRDRARPIHRIGLPLSATAMRAGYQRDGAGAPIFDGETEVSVRIVERLWCYRQPRDRATQPPGISTQKAWRIEFGATAADQPVQVGHHAVVAQEPYSNSWHQNATFKMYSKKKPVEQPCFDVPAGEKDPVGWIEKHCPYDPWERNATLIAGISSSSGPLMKQEPRNIAGDLVLGICPNFDALVSEILEAQEIQHLIRVTERGHMRMGHPKVKKTFRLHPELVDECQMLMLLSVRQALAGPRKEPELWIGKPVWRLADQIYHDHLNERNRTLQRAQRREIAPIKSQLYR